MRIKVKLLQVNVGHDGLIEKSYRSHPSIWVFINSKLDLNALMV
jgi:hypothetical protein